MCGVNTESTKYSIWLLDIAKQCHVRDSAPLDCFVVSLKFAGSQWTFFAQAAFHRTRILYPEATVLNGRVSNSLVQSRRVRILEPFGTGAHAR